MHVLVHMAPLQQGALCNVSFFSFVTWPIWIGSHSLSKIVWSGGLLSRADMICISVPDSFPWCQLFTVGVVGGEGWSAKGREPILALPSPFVWTYMDVVGSLVLQFVWDWEWFERCVVVQAFSLFSFGIRWTVSYQIGSCNMPHSQPPVSVGFVNAFS